MKKYIVLFMAPVAAMQEMMQKMSPEDQQKEMKEWMDWMQKHSGYFADEGAPAGKNTRIDASGVTDVSNDVAGYSIMQANTKEEIIEALKENPHLSMPGAYVEVMEWVDM